MSRSPLRRAAGAAVAVVLGVGVVLVAQPAYADDPYLANRVGDLQIVPSSGQPTDANGGKWTDITASQAFPTGYQATSQLWIGPAGTAQDTSTWKKIVGPITQTTAGLTGLHSTDTSIDLTGTVAWPAAFTSVAQGLAAGVYEVRYYGLPSGVFDPSNSRYFSTNVTFSAGGAWQWTAPVTKTPTHVALNATATSATSVTLSASSLPADASGTVTYKDSTGATVTGGAVTVTGGVVPSVQVSGLSPSTAYTFSATYGGDSAYSGSDATATVTTDAATDTAQTQLGANVPPVVTEAPTGLHIAVPPAATIALSNDAPRNQGESWTVTGQLGNVTVNDDRQDHTVDGWTLTGKASDFTSGANTIAASNLGWAPSKVSGAGDNGATVAPGQSGGLSSNQTLASGAASDEANVETTVNAGLSLLVPDTAPAGSYTSMLTLTLI